MDFLIGTLTRIGGIGIGYARLENNRLRLLWADHTLTDPNWLSVSADGRIFSVSSDMNEPMRGCVNELKISVTGMEVISRQATNGNGPCFLTFSDDGRFIFCANYGTGSVAVLPLNEHGIDPCIQLIQHEGHGTHPTRQKEPHIHQITRIPTLQNCFCAVDLGTDTLTVYQQAKSGLLSERYRISVPAGQGPRHIAYAPDGSAYLITELGSRIYPVTFGEKEGTIHGTGVSTLENSQTPNTAAALWASADGQYLYVSNRGEGTIVQYELPSLRKMTAFHPMGNEPRDFCLIDAHHILTACQDYGLTLLEDGKIMDALPCKGVVRVVKML